MAFACKRCGDTGWVCERHQSLPWTGDRRYLCGGAGAPCPACNPSDKDHPPRMPPDFVPGIKQ